MKYYIAKLLRIPRRFRMIYYIYFNRFKFWLNDVKFGRNMQVYTKLFLNKAPGSKITIGDDFIYTNGDALTHCVAIFVGVFAQDFHTLKLRLVMVRVCLRLVYGQIQVSR